jgi:hypothetical protein
MNIARKLFFVLALLVSPLFAQNPYVQGGSVNASPDTIYNVTGSWSEGGPTYTYHFPQALVAPCTIIVSIKNSGQTVSDSQGNGFVQLGSADSFLWYSTSCSSGADTVTVTCSGLCWSQFTVSDYSGVWVPDQQSSLAAGTGTIGTSPAIAPTKNGELIIGAGFNTTTNTPQITAGSGWTLRANAGEFLEDFVQTTAASVASTVTYSASVSWYQDVFSFSPATAAPTITSANATTFMAGTAGSSFTVTATGTPVPTLSETGTLPSGVTFVNNGNGTATLSGTPASGTQGTYPLTITASNGVGSPATQNFTLTVAAQHSVALSWTAAPAPAVSYNVYRAVASCGSLSNYTLLANTSGLAYTDTTIASGATYCYQVQSVDGSGNISSVPFLVTANVQ